MSIGQDEATLSDMVVGLSPLWVMDKRLSWHSSSGHVDRKLSGLRYDREGKIQNIGERDLPFVSVLNNTETEGYGVGSPSAEGPYIKLEGTLTLMVAAKREFGLFMRNPNAINLDTRYEGVGALEWLHRVRDAIETTAEEPETADWTLEGTVLRPCLFFAGVAEISDLCWTYTLDVKWHIEQIKRAGRSTVSSFVWSRELGRRVEQPTILS